jgi:hypothetical protein
MVSKDMNGQQRYEWSGCQQAIDEFSNNRQPTTGHDTLTTSTQLVQHLCNKTLVHLLFRHFDG